MISDYPNNNSHTINDIEYKLSPNYHLGQGVKIFNGNQIKNSAVTEDSQKKLDDFNSSEDTKINFSIPDELKWTKALQRKFLSLAELEAIGEISETQLQELENLTKLRRKAKKTKTGEEIIWEYKNNQITEKLIESLSEFLKFHEA